MRTVLDGEVVNGVREDGESGVVVGVELVCDVAVDEDVAGLACEDDALGDAGVGAAYPEDLGQGSEAVCMIGRARGPWGFGPWHCSRRSVARRWRHLLTTVRSTRGGGRGLGGRRQRQACWCSKEILTQRICERECLAVL